MGTEQIWTTEFLNDSAWAFRRLVDQAPPSGLDENERRSIQQVEHWLQLVEPLLKEARPGQQLEHVPELGLTKTQLHNLAAKAVGIGNRSAAHANRLAILAPPSEHL